MTSRSESRERALSGHLADSRRPKTKEALEERAPDARHSSQSSSARQAWANPRSEDARRQRPSIVGPGVCRSHRIVSAERLEFELGAHLSSIDAALAQTSLAERVAALRAAVKATLPTLLDEHEDWLRLVRPHHLPLG